MLARKISASSGASAARYGRSAALGCAVALMAHPTACQALVPLSPLPSPLWGGVGGGGLSAQAATPLPNPPPQGGREPAGARRADVPASSRHLPGGAVLGILENDSHFFEFAADAVGLNEILSLARGSA